MRYTLRNVPKSLDRALRQKAKADGTSLNAAALDALRRGLGLPAGDGRYDDLDDVLGSGPLEDEVLRAIREHDVVHPDDMK